MTLYRVLTYVLFVVAALAGFLMFSAMFGEANVELSSAASVFFGVLFLAFFWRWAADLLEAVRDQA